MWAETGTSCYLWHFAIVPFVPWMAKIANCDHHVSVQTPGKAMLHRLPHNRNCSVIQCRLENC